MCSLILSAGCAQEVKIYDDEVCGDAGDIGGGRCFTLLSDKKRLIPPEVWNATSGPDSRIGRISFTAAGFGHQKASLLKLCQVSGDCTVEQVTVLQKIQKNLNEIAGNIRAMRAAAAAKTVAK